MTFVDTHCHLYDEAFDTDRDNAVQRALDAGVTTMLLPDIDSSSSPALDALYNTHPQHFRRMAGLHPPPSKKIMRTNSSMSTTAYTPPLS